ncbi:MAG: FAD-linked oxidase [Candidatus Pelagibacter sp.]|nr:FAD-linked oxidase [Candidatus Pelagibacter sp.]OUV96767.1 MAG: FAD-linked oxidase [Candidatus Pelagibacter sp. TMED142]
MNDIYSPVSEKEVSDFIYESYQENSPIEIVGQNSKKIGRIIQCSKTLSLEKINGIIEYYPEELYIKVKVGTSLEEIENALETKNQTFGFEPIDLGYLYHGKSHGGTIGGVVACNLSGPRRFKVGSLRDHLLGFKAINGIGEQIKSGGTVVKNVTGYDLSKLVSGSYGTLCAFTEVTLKVLPKYEYQETFCMYGLNYDGAIDFFLKAMDTSLEISGACYYPDNNTSFFRLNDIKQNISIFSLRVEGPKTSVQERVQQLKKIFVNEDFSILDIFQSKAFWSLSKNLDAFKNSSEIVCKISLPITKTSEFLNKFSNDIRYFIDWAGGLIWISARDNEIISKMRIFAVKNNGHLTIYKAEANFRRTEEFLTYGDTNLKILSSKIKKSFDPKLILNPGKMYAGV